MSVERWISVAAFMALLWQLAVGDIECILVCSALPRTYQQPNLLPVSLI